MHILGNLNHLPAGGLRTHYCTDVLNGQDWTDFGETLINNASGCIPVIHLGLPNGRSFSSRDALRQNLPLGLFLADNDSLDNIENFGIIINLPLDQSTQTFLMLAELTGPTKFENAVDCISRANLLQIRHDSTKVISYSFLKDLVGRGNMYTAAGFTLAKTDTVNAANPRLISRHEGLGSNTFDQRRVTDSLWLSTQVLYLNDPGFVCFIDPTSTSIWERTVALALLSLAKAGESRRDFLTKIIPSRQNLVKI